MGLRGLCALPRLASSKRLLGREGEGGLTRDEPQVVSRQKPTLAPEMLCKVLFLGRLAK